MTRSNLLGALRAIRRELALGVANAADNASRQAPESRYPHEVGGLRQVATGVGSSLDHVIEQLTNKGKRK